MRGSYNFSIIKIKLPKHLAEWLREFSSQIAMQPDQVIATILTYYYEAWKAGFEKGQRISLHEGNIEKEIVTEVDVEDLIMRFIRKTSTRTYLFIIREFITWIRKNNIALLKVDENTIKAFLERYRKIHNISKNSYYVYRGVLRKFVKYVQQNIM